MIFFIHFIFLTGPLLPTPLPSSSNATTTTKTIEETKDLTTKVGDAITVSPGIISTPAIPALNMMQEEYVVISSPKYVEIATKQGRALNISAPDLNSMANSLNGSADKVEPVPESRNSNIVVATAPNSSKIDLSDVSMDNDDMDLEFVPKTERSTDVNSVKPLGEPRIVNKPGLVATGKSFEPLLVPSTTSSKEVIQTTCLESGVSYKVNYNLFLLLVGVGMACGLLLNTYHSDKILYDGCHHTTTWWL